MLLIIKNRVDQYMINGFLGQEDVADMRSQENTYARCHIKVEKFEYEKYSYTNTVL